MSVTSVGGLVGIAVAYSIAQFLLPYLIGLICRKIESWWAARRLVPGFFEKVPESCLHQLIQHVSPDSRKLLFECSKSLAAHVLISAAKVQLNLQERRELTTEQTQVRRSVITQLLSTRRSFAVRLWPAAWQPLPTELADRVTSLTLIETGSAVAVCCQWEALTNLRAARLRTEADLSGLLDAVEAGHLRHLCSLDVHSWGAPQTIERLVHALGAQLEHITTKDKQVALRVRDFIALRSFHLMFVSLEDAEVLQLCAHPCLRKVTLERCQILGDHSQRRCSWEKLELVHMALEDLPRLPLASVQHVCLAKGLEHYDPAYDAAVRNTVMQHGHKVTCQGDEVWPSFDICNVCRVMIPLLRHMEGVERLRMYGRASDSDVLPSLWEALPSSLTDITFYEVTGMDWTRLWQNLPPHVTSLTLLCCGLTTDEVVTVVRNAPKHIKTLFLTPNDDAERDAWKAARLHAVAPKHLKWRFKEYK